MERSLRMLTIQRPASCWRVCGFGSIGLFSPSQLLYLGCWDVGVRSRSLFQRLGTLSGREGLQPGGRHRTAGGVNDWKQCKQGP
jgi:hypothetical protein